VNIIPAVETDCAKFNYFFRRTFVKQEVILHMMENLLPVCSKSIAATTLWDDNCHYCMWNWNCANEKLSCHVYVWRGYFFFINECGLASFNPSVKIGIGVKTR